MNRGQPFVVAGSVLALCFLLIGVWADARGPTGCGGWVAEGDDPGPTTCLYDGGLVGQSAGRIWILAAVVVSLATILLTTRRGRRTL